MAKYPIFSTPIFDQKKSDDPTFVGVQIGRKPSYSDHESMWAVAKSRPMQRPSNQLHTMHTEKMGGQF